MRKQILLISAIIYLVINLALFPSYFTYADENLYLQQSYELMKGKFILSDKFSTYTYIEKPSGYVSKYPPGLSTLLIPFALINWKLAFLMNICLHLIAFMVFVNILRKLKLDPIWGILYLFFPGLLFFSRTLMSEIPTILFFLLFLNYYLDFNKKSDLIAGALLGASVTLRYTNVFLFVVIIFVCILKKQYKRIFYLTMGILPFGVILAAYNYLVYGGIFSTGYPLIQFSHPFSIVTSLQILGNIILSLSIIYPLLFSAPFLYNGKLKYEIISGLAVFSLLFSNNAWGTNTFFYGFLKNIVIGPRYIFTIVPFMLIPYICLIQNKILKNRKNIAKIIAPIILVLLVAVSSYIAYSQHEFTDNLGAISEKLNTYDYHVQDPANQDSKPIIVDVYDIIYFNPVFSKQRILAKDLHADWANCTKGSVFIFVSQKDHVNFERGLREISKNTMLKEQGYQLSDKINIKGSTIEIYSNQKNS